MSGSHLAAFGAPPLPLGEGRGGLLNLDDLVRNLQTPSLCWRNLQTPSLCWSTEKFADTQPLLEHKATGFLVQAS